VIVMDEKKQSIIDRSMTIAGEVRCEEKVVIEGEISGTFSGSTVIVKETGLVAGKITAKKIECFGKIEGDVKTEIFVMRPTGCHLGIVETDKLEVDPGAIMDCALQSGVHEEKEPTLPQLNRQKILAAFDGSGDCYATDVPWSERRELLDQLLNLLEKGKQLIKITGERGCGKTTLLAKLAEQLPAGGKLLEISDPVGSVRDLLVIVAGYLGDIVAESESQSEIVHRIKTAVSSHADGKEKIVLALDNAHIMYPATMEGIIRYLTSAFGEGDKTVQLILLGTDELEEKLVHTINEYFQDETNCLLSMAPLTIKDTAEYLRYSIQIASNNDIHACMALLPYEIIKKLHTQSGGNLAEINRLAQEYLRTLL